MNRFEHIEQTKPTFDKSDVLKLLCLVACIVLILIPWLWVKIVGGVLLIIYYFNRKKL
jgi:hypothetical protein